MKKLEKQQLADLQALVDRAVFSPESEAESTYGLLTEAVRAEATRSAHTGTQNRVLKLALKLLGEHRKLFDDWVPALRESLAQYPPDCYSTSDRQKGPHLVDLDLSERALIASNFKNARLVRVNFDGSNLAFCSLKGAHIFRSTFVATQFVQSDLSETTMLDCDFGGAGLHRAWLKNSRWEGVSFAGAKLTEVPLEAATIRNSSFVGARIVNAKGKGSRFENTDFTGCHFVNSNLAQNIDSTCTLDPGGTVPVESVPFGSARFEPAEGTTELVLRPALKRRVSAVIEASMYEAIILIIGMTALLAIGDWAGIDLFATSWAPEVGLGVVVIAVLVPIVRAARMRILLSAEVVNVRDLWWSREIPLSDIMMIEARLSGHVRGRFVCKTGRRPMFIACDPGLLAEHLGFDVDGGFYTSRWTAVAPPITN